MAKHSINDFLGLCNSCEACGYGMGKEIITDAGIWLNSLPAMDVEAGMPAQPMQNPEESPDGVFCQWGAPLGSLESRDVKRI